MTHPADPEPDPQPGSPPDASEGQLDDRGPGRRELAVAVGLVVLGAAVALLGGGRSTGTTPGVPTAPGAGGGSSGSTALALVALAGAGAVLLVRNRTRLVLGLVLVGVAAALLTIGLSPVRWHAVLGAVPVALGGLLVLARARRWPQPRGRYDAGPRRTTHAPETPRETWDALDRGEDPTA